MDSKHGKGVLMTEFPGPYEPGPAAEKIPEFAGMVFAWMGELYGMFNTLPFPFRHITVVLLAALAGSIYLKIMECWRRTRRNDRDP